MKSTLPIRHLAAAAAMALICTATVEGAPKKSEPAPVAHKAAAEPKKGFLSKVKSLNPFTKKDSAPAPEKTTAKTSAKKKTEAAPAKVTAAKKAAPAPAKAIAAKKPEPAPAKVKAVANTEAAPAEPKKPGIFKKLFTWKKAAKPEATGPKLAAAKTAKPAPAKEKKAELAAVAEAPKPKRSFLGFFKKLGEPLKKLGEPLEEEEVASTVPDDIRIERPKDWSQYSVIRADEVAFFEDGPSQLGGASDRLSPGTLVKVTSKEKGWAVVEIQGENKRTGYIDALALRSAEQGDFNDPAPPPVQMASANSSYTLDPWAPLAPPPDLPELPGAAGDAFLLLPPLEPLPGLDPLPGSPSPSAAPTVPLAPVEPVPAELELEPKP